MLAADPDNTMVMFGLAKEYEKVGRYEDVIRTLEGYLSKADDEETPTARWHRHMKKQAIGRKP